VFNIVFSWSLKPIKGQGCQLVTLAIRAWRSALSARVPECQKLKIYGKCGHKSLKTSKVINLEMSINEICNSEHSVT